MHVLWSKDTQRACARRTTGSLGGARRRTEVVSRKAAVKSTNAAQERPRSPAVVHGHAVVRVGVACVWYGRRARGLFLIPMLLLNGHVLNSIYWVICYTMNG